MRSHDKRKYNQGRAFQQNEQEEVVDDLLIASMAVASTWCDENKPSQPGVDDSSSESDASTSESSESDADTDGDDVDRLEEATLAGVDKEQGNVPKTLVSAAQKDTNSDGVDEEKHYDKVAQTALKEDSDDDDDDSDIDLTENLANMLDEDDDIPTKKSAKNQKSAFKGPHTENEIDPYTCPTDELEKLNVSVGGSKHDITATQIDDDGGIVVDDGIRKSLKIAGTVRSHIVEQRTIVVDSFIPSSLQSQHDNLVNVALGEGSMLVFVTTKDEEGKKTASSLMGDDGNTSYSLQVIGKIMEVFGPVQRPLYVIRLPEPSTSSPEKDTKLKKDGKTNAKMNDDRQLDMSAEPADETEAQVPSTDDTNEITIEASEEEEEEEEEASRIDENDSSKEDPWDDDGTLTTIIKSCSSTPVYCLMDHANLIDTDQIIRVSGKGCDASNMHDEEVGAKEQEYSDDEEERQAKRKGKKKPARDNNDQRADTNRGKRAGRGDGSRGNNRGDRGNWREGNGHSQTYQPHHQQPNFGYPPPNQMYHGHPQNQMYQSYPQNQIYQAHPPQNFAHAQPHYQNVPQYPQYQYQQHQQQQHHQHQQSQQHPYQQQPYHQQQQYAAYLHGVPPPPPPPPTQTQAQQTTESDTVYYDYSGS